MDTAEAVQKIKEILEKVPLYRRDDVIDSVRQTNKKTSKVIQSLEELRDKFDDMKSDVDSAIEELE